MLITGTSKGIGLELYNYFKSSYNIITVNRSINIGTSNNIKCDLSNSDDIIKLCETISDLDIDIVINNSGGSQPLKFECLDYKIIESILNLNFVAPTLIMKSVLPKLVKKDYGRVINISSISAKEATPYLHIYSASKSALNSVTQSCAKQNSNDNITINAICPGIISTESSITGRKAISQLKGELPNVYEKQMLTNANLESLISPIEVVKYIEFLLSHNAKSISGQLLNICGSLIMN